TDWFPTLLAAAGAASSAQQTADSVIDGVDIFPLLRGEPHEVPPQRFWQWNRYAPIAECNAAMRDGRWKLVRPSIPRAMEVEREDMAMDVGLKSTPEAYESIRDEPLPDRDIDSVPAPQLFDLDRDPGE